MQEIVAGGQDGSGTIDAVSGDSQQAPDLVAFAKALFTSGTQVFGAAWCNACTLQKELFGDGAGFLPFVEVTNPDRTLNQTGMNRDITTLPTWIFPDDSRSTGVLDLQTISDRSGIPIPMSNQPSLKPIDDVTLLAGSPLHIALDGYDPNGDALTYAVTSSNPLVTPTVLSGNRSIRINTTGWGEMVFQLFEQQVPRPTERFIELANSGFYDGLQFYRIIEGFVIQGGDPYGTGVGGSVLGYFDDQFDVDLQHNQAGVLSFAKSTDDTNDSQFFVTLAPTRHLDFNHSVFGKIVEGQQTLGAIGSTATDIGDRPLFDVRMDTVQVFQDTENALVMLKADPSAVNEQADITVTVTDADGNTSQQIFHVVVAPDTYNGGPFLADFPEFQTSVDTPVPFTLSAIDVEGDSVVFEAWPVGEAASYAYVNVDQQTGDVVVTPTSGYSGTLEIFVGVRQATLADTSDAWDTQRVVIHVVGDAPELDLLASSDSNIDNDNVTNITDMTFRVTGVSDGSLVQLLANGIVIGQATATGNSVLIQSNTLATMGDGTYDLTAIQTLDGIGSVLPHTLQVTLDTTAPAPLTSVPPVSAATGVPLWYDAEHPEEGNTGFRFLLIGAPAGASIDALTGQFSWTPSPLQGGTTMFQIQASDLAGNTVSQPVQIDVTVVEPLVRIRLETTDLDGNPITTIDPGQDFLLSGYVKDLRDSGQGVFAAYLDVLYDAALVSAVDRNVGDITFGDSYQNGKSGSLETPGLIDEVGAFGGVSSLGDAERLLFTVQISAVTAGTVQFTGRHAEDLVHDVLLFGANTPVAPNEMTYVPATLTIGADPGEELVASNDVFIVDEDSPTTPLDVLANDASTSGTTIRIVAVEAPSAGGTVTIAADGQQLNYTPAANFFGEDHFQYTITNGSLTSSATVFVQVFPVNDPPTTVNDQFTVDGGSVANLLHVLDNDTDAPDAGEALSVASVGQPDHGGWVVIAPDGTRLLYTPAPSFIGSETFAYSITDGNGGVATATVTVTVTPRINFVDANNNGSFDAGVDVPLIRGELEDGSFSTAKKEGGYTTVISGAGLVIKVGIVSAKDLDFRADGHLVVEATLDAGRDVRLHGSAMALNSSVTAGRDIGLDAAGRIEAVGGLFRAGRDIILKANGQGDLVLNAALDAERDIQLAGYAIAVHGTVHAARDITLKADGPITAIGAVLQAGRDVSLTADGVVDSASIVLDWAAVIAGRNVAIVAKRGSVSVVGATVTAAKKAEVTARDQIFADWATVSAGVEIDLTADDILGNGLWNAPKIKIKTT